MTRTRSVLVLLACGVLGACASRSVDVQPEPADPTLFAAWSCDAMNEEMDRVQQRAADVAYAVDARAGNNAVALGIGATVFWPALLAMRPDGPDAAELARLKGRFEALQHAAATQRCAPPSEWLSAEQAAALPVAVGERLVYEERSGPRGPTREFGLRLRVLKRQQFEFEADLAGTRLPQVWQQDAVGNVLPLQGPADLLYWTRLLRRDLALGDVLSGDVHGGQGTRARLRGQVIALGLQSTYGRPFDAAVIELFGEVLGALNSARVEGVMVVDRKSGVLLRLELRSPEPEFELRRTLLRIQPAP
jgi:hypothetical protein